MTVVMIGKATPAAATAADTFAAFEALLAHNDSATAALGDWCHARGLAPDPVIAARPLAGPPRPATAQARRLLAVSPREPLGYRHVALTCGGLVLSRARNWYVPARLPPAQRAELARGSRPFGAVIAPLGFTRQRLGSVRGASAGCPSSTILTNRALIRLASGKPLALVIECYQPAVLRQGKPGLDEG